MENKTEMKNRRRGRRSRREVDEEEKEQESQTQKAPNVDRKGLIPTKICAPFPSPASKSRPSRHRS
jgi:hypothetical protein